MSTHSKSDAVARSRRKREQAAKWEIKEQILITQVIGSIMPSEDGSGSHPLQAAFEQVAEFMANNAADDTLELTFSIGEYEFTTACYPKRTPQSEEEARAY
jgi:hypothetical protein